MITQEEEAKLVARLVKYSRMAATPGIETWRASMYARMAEVLIPLVYPVPLGFATPVIPDATYYALREQIKIAAFLLEDLHGKGLAVNSEDILKLLYRLRFYLEIIRSRGYSGNIRKKVYSGAGTASR